jgi:membrane protease YdiL (CAAX protease family)
MKKTAILKNVTKYSAFLLLFWGFYRFLFKFPDEIEELLIKPVVWLVPIFYFNSLEKMRFGDLGLTLKNLFSSIYFALGLGSIFVMEAVITNYLKYGGLNFGANIGDLPLITSLGLSFATSFSEELSFRGYIFGRLLMVLKNETAANLIQTAIWTAIHVPIAFFVWKLNLSAGLIYLFLTAIFGFGSAYIYGRTKNIFGSIFLHVLWEWPIILFR